MVEDKFLFVRLIAVKLILKGAQTFCIIKVL